MGDILRVVVEMNVEMFVFDDEEGCCARQFLLYAILIGRGDEELESKVIREGQKLVTPLRVDSVERFVEKKRLETQQLVI